MTSQNTFYKISSGLLLSLSLLSFSSSLKLMSKELSLFLEWRIVSYNSNSIVMSMIFDKKSMLFLSTVFLISSFIMVYSIYYMEGDQNLNRFSYILLFFISSMVFLIISPNLISLMLGWDGLGLTSYALVIYYQTEYSANSGMITILSNRVGDSTIMLAIAWMLYKGSHNFSCLQTLDKTILFLIVLSSFTKSAQLPFSAWLPAAMAAPTPVSALVHSSTLVTAGVFLMIRFMPLLESSILVYMILTAGLMTMVAAGWVANFETDLKKIIALSTLSQLGLMFTILGLKNQNLAFLHLIMHALFKSALFMGAGFIIHNMNNSQEGRFTNSFNISSPLLCVLFSCTNMSLCGLPFMTGFFSKDAVLEQSFSQTQSKFIFFMIVLATGFTLAYSLRSSLMISSQKSINQALSSSNDLDKTLIYACHMLFLLSILGGWMISWLVEPSIKIFVLSYTEKFSILTTLTLASIMIFKVTKKNFSPLKKTMSFFSHLLVFTPFMTKSPLVKISMSGGKTILNLSEKGWLEELGAGGATKVSSRLSLFINKSNLIVLVTQFVLAFSVVFMLVLVYCFL